MPWLETSPMDQRMQFIVDYQRGLHSVTELADRFSISRKTAYKWRHYGGSLDLPARGWCEGAVQHAMEPTAPMNKCTAAHRDRVVSNNSIDA
jgi:hypothetical protein